MKENNERGPLFTRHSPTVTVAEERQRYMPQGLSLNSTKEKATLPQKMWLTVQRSWQFENVLLVAEFLPGKMQSQKAEGVRFVVHFLGYFLKTSGGCCWRQFSIGLSFQAFLASRSNSFVSDHLCKDICIVNNMEARDTLSLLKQWASKLVAQCETFRFPRCSESLRIP